MRSTRLLSWSKRLLGLDAVPVPPHVFAVDGRRLRYGRFGRNGAGFELDEYRATDLEHDLFASGPLGGPLHDPEHFRSALAEVQKSLSGPVTAASLVLPDGWLRLTVLEGEALPRAAADRDEVLRWKLQQTVPFRVEELRVRGMETRIGFRLDKARRVLLGFALDTLLQQLEAVFADRQVQIGLVSNESLSLLAGVQDALRDVELGALAFVSAGGYSLTFVLRGEPILHRCKALPQLSQDEPPWELVHRDLRLTEIYLREQIQDTILGRVLLVSPPELEERWTGWLGEVFDSPTHPIRLEHLPLSIAVEGVPLSEALTLLGAARQEVG